MPKTRSIWSRFTLEKIQVILYFDGVFDDDDNIDKVMSIPHVIEVYSDPTTHYLAGAPTSITLEFDSMNDVMIKKPEVIKEIKQKAGKMIYSDGPDDGV